MEERVIVRREAGIVFLTMSAGSRPSMVDVDTCVALVAALSEISPDKGDRAVVLNAAGRVFSAGGNLAYIETTLSDPPRLLGPLIDRFHEVILALRRLPLPVVASVHGAAAGAGFSLAMACDIVVSARSARFVAGYPKIGTSSDGGLTWFLSHHIGPRAALDVFFLREQIDATQAHALGMVNLLVADEELHNQTLEAARRLAAHPQQAVREIKTLVGAAVDSGLEQHLAREKDAFLRCAATPDFQRLVRDFVNQRKPR
jgi:2-(1,2-epoxy-1,2-dihydrophenyl)acetyl-CoA isomerase